MVSIETAFGITSLVAVTAAILAAMAALAAYVAAVDSAGAAARAAAIGVDYTPARGGVEHAQSGGLHTVTARVPALIGVMQAKAVFPHESAR